MESKDKKIGIYGFGRMGLTHYAILNQLLDGAKFTFKDVDKRLNFFVKQNIRAKLIFNDDKLVEGFDFTLICTPPMFHISTIEKCLKRGDKNIFVEKPFGGIDDDFTEVMLHHDKIKIGYVMRFNPVIQWLKEHISTEKVVKVHGSYFSNTIEKKPKGWRNGKYSGVLNEMGAHIIDLAVYLFGLNKFHIKKKEVQSIVSDIDDIVKVDLESNNIDYHFCFDWVNRAYRKPVFDLKIFLEDGRIYVIDQQRVKIYNEDVFEKSISVVDLVEEVPFYLRGVDFTNQMRDLIGNQSTLATVDEALINRNIIKDILA